jgi:hypothetical protein
MAYRQVGVPTSDVRAALIAARDRLRQTQTDGLLSVRVSSRLNRANRIQGSCGPAPDSTATLKGDRKAG